MISYTQRPIQNRCIHQTQDNAIYLKGLGNTRPVPFPAFITYLSELIRVTQQRTPTRGSKTNPIHLPFPYEFIEAYQRMVLSLIPAARDEHGDAVEETEINPFTIFVHPLVNNELREILPPVSVEGNEVMSGLLSLSNFLGIFPITHSLTYSIADRLYPLQFDIYPTYSIPFTTDEYDVLLNNLTLSGFTSGFTNRLLPPELLELIAKHLYLKHFGRQELTVLDMLGLYGQPPILDRTLDLRNKKLTTLDGLERIHEIQEVTTFNLEGNQILGVLLNTEQLRPVRNIESLNLNKNNLMSIPPLGLPNLRFLDLSQNQLPSLPAETFQHTPALAILILTSNRLTTLPDTLFDPLPQLQRLFINFNHLCFLPLVLFRNLRRLHKLDLQWNKLFTLPTQIFIPLESLRTLDITRNNFPGTESQFRAHYSLPAPEYLRLSFWPQNMEGQVPPGCKIQQEYYRCYSKKP